MIAMWLRARTYHLSTFMEINEAPGKNVILTHFVSRRAHTVHIKNAFHGGGDLNSVVLSLFLLKSFSITVGRSYFIHF
jgi:hypothetical protein